MHHLVEPEKDLLGEILGLMIVMNVVNAEEKYSLLISADDFVEGFFTPQHELLGKFTVRESVQVLSCQRAGAPSGRTCGGSHVSSTSDV